MKEAYGSSTGDEDFDAQRMFRTMYDALEGTRRNPDFTNRFNALDTKSKALILRETIAKLLVEGEIGLAASLGGHPRYLPTISEREVAVCDELMRETHTSYPVAKKSDSAMMKPLRTLKDPAEKHYPFMLPTLQEVVAREKAKHIQEERSLLEIDRIKNFNRIPESTLETRLTDPFFIPLEPESKRNEIKLRPENYILDLKYDKSKDI